VYHQFMTVVCLTHQMHVQDMEWTMFLCHSWHGKCMKDQLHMLQGLLLGSARCPETKATEPPGINTVLVTAHHAVWVQWNELTLRSHCGKTCNKLYRFHAEDIICGCQLTLSEHWALACHMFKDNSHSSRLKCQGGLTQVVKLAIGCKEPQHGYGHCEWSSQWSTSGNLEQKLLKLW
jgi:hypothetical protein